MVYDDALQLFKLLQSELDQEMENEQLLNSISNAIDKVRAKIVELETHIKTNPLKDESEEVLYFKKIHPMFCAELIYYAESYNLEKELQLIDKNEWVVYLKEEIKTIQRFFRKNSFLYEYYRLDLKELDHIYFTANGAATSHLLPELPALDFTAVAKASYIIAKIIAFEKLRENIQSKLSGLDLPARTDVLPAGKAKLKWTGDVVNLVELAYGIWLTGQLNNGNASLNEIVRWLETNLQVSIGIIQRKFTEIGGRKRLSPTKYIDQMRDHIIQKIENDNL